MAEIKTTGGHLILLDDADIELVGRTGWIARTYSRNSARYAVKCVRAESGGRRHASMHRLILGVDGQRGAIVDHINRNTLDNRRENLRIVTHRQNSHNRSKQRGTSSRFKGVSFVTRKQAWHAAIRVGAKDIHLGDFADERLAALAYDDAAIAHFGEFACTNKSQGLL